ncbi:hypothetical protein A2U01_0049813 [Trifolium medium]|uniref:Uncharacterized protein n=1 Tax=Trifolium medium TaxID=97028 RepID=A0A392QW73_9FABA|nr:hypothetical protein [Trifolium medium]
MRDCLQKLMDQGLVQIGYSRADTDVSVLESRDPAPIEIPYPRRGLQIPVKPVDPIVFHVPHHFPLKARIGYHGTISSLLMWETNH